MNQHANHAYTFQILWLYSNTNLHVQVLGQNFFAVMFTCIPFCTKHFAVKLFVNSGKCISTKLMWSFHLWQSFWCPMTFDPFNFSWKKYYQKICFLILLHHYNLYNLSFIAATCKFQEICIWEFLCWDAFWLSNLIRLDVVLAWADDSVI